MGFGAFDQANLAVVAYAHVNSDGTSPDCNSGVTTSKTNTGIYKVTLPLNLAQSSSRIFCLVTPINGGPVAYFVSTSTVTDYGVDFFTPGAGALDYAFQIVFLRTIETPPAGAPA